MVEYIFVSLLLVLVILLVANPIQAKIAEDQRISSNNTMTSNVQTLPRTFILDSWGPVPSASIVLGAVMMYLVVKFEGRSSFPFSNLCPDKSYVPTDRCERKGCVVVFCGGSPCLLWSFGRLAAYFLYPT